jgi:hypothetical protein
MTISITWIMTISITWIMTISITWIMTRSITWIMTISITWIMTRSITWIMTIIWPLLTHFSLMYFFKNKSEKGRACSHVPLSRILLENLTVAQIGNSAFLCAHKVHFHNRPPHVSILSQINPIHNHKTRLFKIHFNSILQSLPRLSKWSLPFRVSDWNFIYMSHLSHACYTARSIRLPWFDNPNYIWRMV